MKSRHRKVGHSHTRADAWNVSRWRRAARGGVWRPIFRRDFLRCVDRPHVPRILRFPVEEELAIKSHRRQGDPTAAAAAVAATMMTRRSEGGGFRKEKIVTGRKHDHRKKNRFSFWL